MLDPVQNDLTLDEVRQQLGPLLPTQAAFDGWTDASLIAAAAVLGISDDLARLAVDRGPVQMVDLWFASIDRAMAQRLPADQVATLRIRDRIQSLVWVRIEMLAPHREALRRALALLAPPPNAPAALRLEWRAADAMWRLAGDRSTGFAYYSKRTTLAAVYASTVLALLQDDSPDLTATREFLDRRIGNVMAFEKLKAQLRPDPERHFDLARFAGRLRYPER